MPRDSVCALVPFLGEAIAGVVAGWPAAEPFGPGAVAQHVMAVAGPWLHALCDGRPPSWDVLVKVVVVLCRCWARVGLLDDVATRCRCADGWVRRRAVSLPWPRTQVPWIEKIAFGGRPVPGWLAAAAELKP